MPNPSAHRLEDLIGNTPLVRLCRIEKSIEGLAPDVQIYGKAEFFNPGGSVKDRPALNMILEGEKSGKLTPGKIILDATSGNTGIAYAMIGAARGYTVRLCLPRNVSPERKKILAAYGAEIVYTSPAEQSDGDPQSQADVCRRPGPVLLPGPVRQRCQLAGTLQDHRS